MRTMRRAQRNRLGRAASGETPERTTTTRRSSHAWCTPRHAPVSTLLGGASEHEAECVSVTEQLAGCRPPKNAVARGERGWKGGCFAIGAGTTNGP